MVAYFEWSDDGLAPPYLSPTAWARANTDEGGHYPLERKVMVRELDAETGEVETRTEYRVVCAACVPKYDGYRPWPWHRPDGDVSAGAPAPE